MIEIILNIAAENNMLLEFIHSEKGHFAETIYMFRYDYELFKPGIILMIVLPNNAISMHEQELKTLIEHQLPLGGDK